MAEPPNQQIIESHSANVIGHFLFFLAAATFMVVEARKHGIRLVWAYIIGGYVIAAAVFFPLFLIARERALASEPSDLRAIDSALLMVFAAATGAFAVWLFIW